MRAVLVLVASALVFATGAGAAPKEPSGSLELLTPAPYAFADELSFSAEVSNLRGNQYPLVYVECRSVVDDEVLYGQLASADETFLLGGGSSPWHLPENAGEDANCVASLRVYGGKDSGSVILDSLGFFASG